VTLCAVGLLTYAVVVTAQSFLLRAPDRKEFHMDKNTENTKTSSRFWNAILLTTTAVGAKVTSGVALLG
jgi:hypothetical protein